MNSLIKILTKCVQLSQTNNHAILLNACRFRSISILSALNTINYKTPTNRSKKFSPQTVPVTKANAHLEILLLDQKGIELGRMNMR
jgi:hypothetical protein